MSTEDNTASRARPILASNGHTSATPSAALRRELEACLLEASSDGWSGDAAAISPEDAAEVALHVMAPVLREAALMIRWRIVAQRWTPGGSEYMDPAYCETFIRDRRLEAHRTMVAEVVMRRALERIARGDVPPDQHGHYLAHRDAVRTAREALRDGAVAKATPAIASGAAAAPPQVERQNSREDSNTSPQVEGNKSSGGNQ